MINKKPFLQLLLTGMLWCVAGYGTPSYGQSPYIQHYTTKEGLPSNNCYYMLQDSVGFLWVATDAGVARFDGNRFETFTIDDGLPDNQILRIYEDKRHRIWFVAFNGELSYFFNGKIYNSLNDKTLSLLKFNAVVISVYHDSEDRLWFGTNKNMLFMFDGKNLTKFSSSDLANQFLFSYVNEDPMGTIWIYSNNCVRVYKDGKFTRSTQRAVTPISTKAMVPLQNNAILFIDSLGLHHKKGNQTKLIRKLNTSLADKDLGMFYADGDNLWLSHKNGVTHQDKAGKLTNYLSGVTAVQIIEDDNNNIWFTTVNGIYMMPRAENRMFTLGQKEGLSSNIIKSIAKDKNNNLWLGMDGASINKLHPNRLTVQHINVPDKRHFEAGIKKIVIDTTSQSLYFSSDYGLGVLPNMYSQPQSFRFLTEKNNSVFVVKDFCLAEDGAMALALSSGVTIIKDRHHTLNFSMPELKDGIDFFKNRSYSVFFDQANSLWFSNVNGLFQFTGNTLKPAIKNSRLDKRVNDIDQLKDGTMIMATDGYGLVFTKNNKLLHRFTTAQGLSSNICKKIFIVKNHIWIVTNKGINRVCLDNKVPVVEAFHYTNALLKNDVNDLYVDNDTAYFATNNGLVYFRTQSNHEQISPPKVIISSIVVNKEKVRVNDPNIEIKASGNKIVFNFNVIDFQDQDILFRYRLKPEDPWAETKNRRIEFSSLSPGKYTFEMSAKSGNKDWGPAATANFKLRARFWQTTSFIILLLIVAAYTFYRIAVVVTQKQKNKEQQTLLFKNQILVLEQRALQAMMNPHFVFNVMNSIQHYINTKDTSSANKVLTGFAKLIRKNLEICTKSYVSLEEEIEYLALYLSLEKKRFGDKLRYEIVVSPEIDKEETIIPSMLLQPYIENAIWHGIMPLEKGGNLTISMKLEAGQLLLIEIVDNGVGIENSLKHKKFSHTSKGMSLTQERINLINQIEANPIHTSVQQNGDSGTLVRISIQLK